MSPFQELIYKHIAVAMDRQIHLARTILEWEWQLDFASAEMTFTHVDGEEVGMHTSGAQLLGSESDEAQTWLWGWANDGLEAAPSFFEAALQLRALGEERGIDVFTEAEFGLDAVDGETLALIASGVTGAAGYYRCPYAGGAAFVLLTNDDFREPIPHPLVHVSLRFPQVIMMVPLENHRRALLGFLSHFDVVVGSDAQAVRASDVATGDRLVALFDEQGRLADIEVNSKGGSPSSAR